MISLDTYNGFLILLIVPLLYLYRRRKSATKDLEFSLFPLLANMERGKDFPVLRRLRIPRGIRTLLVAVCLFSLVLSYNGIHWKVRTDEPGEWLLIFDNSHSSRAKYNGTDVLTELKSRARVLFRKTGDADRYTLLVTSPKPELLENLERKNLLSLINAIRPSDKTTDVVELVQIARILSQETRYKEVAIISPRSHAWRIAMDREPLRSSIPPDGKVFTGNAGITVLDVTAAGPELFNLYVRTASKGLDQAELKIVINSENRSQKTHSVPIGIDGSSELYLPGIALEPGKTSVSLLVEDIFSPDNVGEIRNTTGNQEEISVQLRGTTRMFMDAFLNAYPTFKTDRRWFTPDVTIYDSVQPEPDNNQPALVIFPAQPFGDFKLKRVWAVPLAARFHPGHPAVENALNFRQFRPGKILEYQVPQQFQVLADAEGIPLIVAGAQNGKPMVVWFFDPADNGIYLDPAFPILLHDTLLWLTRGEQVQTTTGLCQASLRSNMPDSSDPVDDSFFKCMNLVHEAARISLPDLSGIFIEGSELSSHERKELAKLFLLLALAILVLLSLDRTEPGGWER